MMAAAVLLAVGASVAQHGAFARGDSALVHAILTAEDRRDSTTAAIRQGMAHGDARVSTMARRALARIRSAQFASRDSFPALAPSVAWAEPQWRLRLRALAARREDCAAMRAALADSALPVRFRAMAVASAACGSDSGFAAALRALSASPAATRRRVPGTASWHLAAHAVVAMGRTKSQGAREASTRLASHPLWEVRMYAARAAGQLGDRQLLRRLAGDVHPNVQEAAIEALARIDSLRARDVLVRMMASEYPQVARAAAAALERASDIDTGSVEGLLRRWIARGVDSERDVIVALRKLLGQPAGPIPGARTAVPREAVGLALGRDVRLRVTMADSSGGGAFTVRLRGDAAPIMAARILELVRSGYYDGTPWHRVEHDFVVQGGGPGSNEYVGYQHFLRDELSTLPHTRGTIGMSTRGHDTGDAQWFFNLKDNLRLGRDYTVFAEVVEGIDIVDGLFEGDVISTVRVVPDAPGM